MKALKADEIVDIFIPQSISRVTDEELQKCRRPAIIAIQRQGISPRHSFSLAVVFDFYAMGPGNYDNDARKNFKRGILLNNKLLRKLAHEQDISIEP